MPLTGSRWLGPGAAGNQPNDSGGGLSEGLSLAELASSVGLSESQFARAFKVRMGVSPHRYLMALHLDQAQRLLRATDPSIAEVATECGFANQEHLTRVMRSRLDITPGALRRSLR